MEGSANPESQVMAILSVRTMVAEAQRYLADVVQHPVADHPAGFGQVVAFGALGFDDRLDQMCLYQVPERRGYIVRGERRRQPRQHLVGEVQRPAKILARRA